ncbi:MAG TPA: hypothetical protein VK012_04885 [Gemmatimonadales bacterium]|nr:hypothetical protein [Gemmatimonadales bacterium]
MTRALPILATLLVTAPVAAIAQSDSDQASALVSVVRDGFVSVVRTEDLNFGVQVAGTTVRSSDVPTAAVWHVEFNEGGMYTISYSLPSGLGSEMGYPDAPISFGPTSSFISYEFGDGVYDPAVPMTLSFSAGQSYDFSLGADIQNDGSGDAILDLSGAVFGSYVGTIMLTVAMQ